jgi:ABC-type phosphate transport system substrate-binding protein
MLSRVLFFFFLARSIHCSVSGDVLYAGFINEWSFAYDVASDVKVEYNNNVQGSDSTVSLISHLDITPEIASSMFLCPLVHYPIAIAYNIPLFNDSLAPLTFTPQLLTKMITNTTMAWSDPDLLALNPGLSRVGSLPVRMIFSDPQSTTNQYLIDYLFANETARNGSWLGLTAPKHTLAKQGYPGVASALGLVSNTVAFLPLPYLTANMKTARLMLNNSIVSHDDTPPFDFVGSSMHIEEHPSDSTWPLNIYVYMMYDPEPTNRSEQHTDLVDIFRFFYWAFGSHQLTNQTQLEGFRTFPYPHTALSNHLLQARTRHNHQPILQYKNLSNAQRSTAIFAIACVCIVAYISVVIGRWFMLPTRQRREPVAIANHAVVILGLLLSWASFCVWWYAPSSDSICISRFWLLGLGYTNVIASIYVYEFSMHTLRNMNKSIGVSGKRVVRKILAAYILLELFEILILVLWTVVEQPRSLEVVTNAIRWETLYACQARYGVMDVVQVVYFCVISLFGCAIIFIHWKSDFGKRDVPEDSRWLLIALQMQIVVFLFFIALTKIIEYTDENLYVFTIAIFLINEFTVAVAFFLPRIIATMKVKAKSFTNTSQRGGASSSGISPSESMVTVTTTTGDQNQQQSVSDYQEMQERKATITHVYS